MSQYVEERELGWDDKIVKDDEFILLPDGDYDFMVESFERGRHGGSDKLPPCNKAVLRLRIDAPQGSASILHNLFLHTKTEGMLSSFFSAIGEKKKGEALKMNWNKVVGAKGRCKITHKLYKDNEYNEIKKFYPKEEQKVGSNFTPGAF